MGTFLTAARARRKTFDVLLAGIPGDLSFSYVSAMFHGSQRGGALDYTGFHSAPLDVLLSRSTSVADGPLRLEAWRNVQVALDSLVPATWLFHSRGVQGLSARVRGVRMDLRGELVSLHDWRLAPPGQRR